MKKIAAMLKFDHLDDEITELKQIMNENSTKSLLAYYDIIGKSFLQYLGRSVEIDKDLDRLQILYHNNNKTELMVDGNVIGEVKMQICSDTDDFIKNKYSVVISFVPSPEYR